MHFIRLTLTVQEVLLWKRLSFRPVWSTWWVLSLFCSVLHTRSKKVSINLSIVITEKLSVVHLVEKLSVYLVHHSYSLRWKKCKIGAIQGAIIPGYSGTTYAYYVIWDLSAATRLRQWGHRAELELYSAWHSGVIIVYSFCYLFFVCSHFYVFKGTVLKHYSCGAGNIGL